MADGGVLAGTPSALSTEQTVKTRAAFILKELGDRSPGVILDAGCGLGTYLGLLSQIGSRVMGVDISGEYLSQAGLAISQDVNDRVVGLAQMSVEQMGFPDGVFDAIVCIENLEHVPDDEAAVREFRRVLKPGGRFLVSVPNKWFPFETHGIRLGSRVVGTPLGLGVPLLSLLPSGMRRWFATARVYAPRHLVDLLEKNGLVPEKVRFLMPGLDSFERQAGSTRVLTFLVFLLRKTLAYLQSRLFKTWGSTVIISGQAQ